MHQATIECVALFSLIKISTDLSYYAVIFRGVLWKFKMRLLTIAFRLREGKQLTAFSTLILSCF